MSEATAFISGASYVLGERQADHTAIANLTELAGRFKLAPNPGLWGWGSIRITERELEHLAADAGRATLRAAGIAQADVEALVLCSNRIPGPAEGHGRFVADVLTGTGLGDIPCYGVTLNRCVNLLAGLDVARALVVSGRYRAVLVVTTDKVAAGGDRMSQFALFSDGAAACLVTAGHPGAVSGPGAATVPGAVSGLGGATVPGAVAGPGAAAGEAVADAGCYELLATATAQQTASLEWTSQISADLARQVNDRLTGPFGLKLGDIAALMHANLFKPLVMMKERQAGFAPEQLYPGNIDRIGHCFAADPLINLVDRAALGHVGSGGVCMLASSVPGSRIGALLRRAE